MPNSKLLRLKASVTKARLRFNRLWGSNPFRYWMWIQSTAIFISVNMAIQLNAFVTNYVIEGNKHYHPESEVTVSAPLILIMIFVSTILSRRLFRYANQITDGIKAVAEGDFDTQLDVEKGGPYKAVYKNFNKMTHELNSVETLRSDFINKFSHEFKTPITSINGFAELLLHTDVDPADQKVYLEIIANESARLADLSKNVMILTSLESQEIIPEKKEYDLEEQLKQIAIMVLPQLTHKNIELDIELVPARYVGNADIMAHVWTNLLNNALKFTNENGKIGISLKKEATQLVITIRDNGVGMTPETATHIFDKFYQQDKTGVEKGLGLGLSIVGRIVELVEGSVTVASEVNRGTEFTVKLPIKE